MSTKLEPVFNHTEVAESLHKIAEYLDLQLYLKYETDYDEIQCLFYDFNSGKSRHAVIYPEKVTDITLNNILKFMSKYFNVIKDIDLNSMYPVKPIVMDYYKADVEVTKAMINYARNEKYFGIKKVIFNDPATIVFWNDGSKTVVKCQGDDIFDPEKGLAMAISKRALGDKSNFNDVFKKWVPKEWYIGQVTRCDMCKIVFETLAEYKSDIPVEAISVEPSVRMVEKIIDNYEQ